MIAFVLLVLLVAIYKSVNFANLHQSVLRIMQAEKLSEASEFRAGGLAIDGEIDFSQARKLETGGSICDTYEARHHRRRVFVKRLKNEYCNSSLHRAALDKEFDVGVTLNHKSLPRYLEIHDSYIMMDFIDGNSLHQMMVSNDPWLNSEKHLWRFLKQLIEVTGYLHNRHIVHCDIKPDNILLTCEERDVVLIDLDKCHTDWLDDTSGKQRFRNGVDSPEGVSTDFEAIGGIIDLWLECVPTLRKKSIIKFRNLCYRKNVTIEQLKDFIDRQGSNSYGRSFRNLSVIAVILSVGLVACVIIFQKNSSEKVNEESNESIIAESTVKNTSDTTIIAIDGGKTESMPKVPTLSKVTSNSPDIASIAEKIFSRNNAPTMKALEEFRKICEDSALTQVELFSRTPALTKMYYDAFNATHSEILETYPNIDPRTIDDAIILCKSFQNYMKEWKETLEIINKREVSKIVSDTLDHLN